MKKKEHDSKEALERAITDGYMRLVEAVVLHALETLTVPKNWKVGISARTLGRKEKDVKKIAEWLKTDNANSWFYYYEIANGMDSDRTKRRFKTVLRQSKRRLKKISTAPPIDK